MAIGTAAALAIGATAIGGAASSMSASKAAGKAADGSLQAAKENNALARETYAKNEGYLSPYIGTGQTAGNYLNAFLGLPTEATTSTSGSPNYAGYVQSSPDLLAEFGRVGGQFGGDMGAYGQFHHSTYGQSEGRTVPGQTTTTQPAVTGQDAQNAFGNYIGNSDYGFQFATGANQVNSGYAGAGTMQSGAAMKALEGYRQNLQSGYRNQYMSALGNQQGVGLSAGSALAGVGQNYVNTISGNNNNAADAVGNAALIKGQNNPFASILGSAGGAMIGMGR